MYAEENFFCSLQTHGKSFLQLFIVYDYTQCFKHDIWHITMDVVDKFIAHLHGAIIVCLI